MGHFCRVSPAQVLPSQDFLKEDTLRHIFECIQQGKRDHLPPPPIVRRHPTVSGKYIAIDGHNLLAVCEERGEDCEVYVADSAGDSLPNPERSEAVSRRNADLAAKYTSSVREAERLQLTFRILFAQTTRIAQVQ